MTWNRAGETRYGVHSIDHFALEVPSLSKAHDFFAHFGLDVVRHEGVLELRAFGSPHVWARIHEGPAKRLAYLSVGCWQDEYEPLVEQALAQGARPAGGAPYTDGHGLWFTDPDGNLLQLRPGPKVTPSGLRSQSQVPPRAGQRGVSGRALAMRTQPSRLSHVLMFTPNIARAIDFYGRALGLRLSDRSRDAVAFMHGRHGSDHHLVAFASSSARGWHHSSWDVDGIEAVGKGGEQMRKAGYTEGWGTGRHVLGSNYFHYVRDPWGSFAEYSADIDFIATGMSWPTGDHAPEDSLYLWGPEVPDYFFHNSEASP